jgi:MFS family permease
VTASRAVGGRDLVEIARYSAHPSNYLAATPLSLLWGWTSDRWGDSELRLFPGIVAVVLSLFSVANRSWRWTVLYAVVALLAVDLSFGINGAAYRWLSDHVGALHGLRSASRFAMLAMCGVAMLAALGTQAIVDRGLLLSWKGVVVPVILGLVFLDYANRPMPLGREDLGTSDVYKVIRSSGPGVIMELPVATPDRLPGWDASYAFWSISHWHPLVNGYSGYHPADYLNTLMAMRTFPDNASIARLQAHDVKYVVLHRAYYEPERYTQLVLKIAVRPELKAWGTYRDPVGTADVFVLDPLSH